MRSKRTAAIMAAIAIAAASLFADGLTARFYDVGCADSALIECDGHYMLVDAGNVNDSQKIFTVLKRDVEGGTLDYAVMTHCHEDHGGGMASALFAVGAKEAWCPNNDATTKFFRNFLKKAKERGLEPSCPATGSVHRLGGATIKVLGPEDPSASVENKNNTSIVLLVSYAGRKILMTGDAEREEEQFELDRFSKDLGDIDVIKVPHHGSASSSTYPYLRKTMPAFAVCSTDEKGEGAQYNLPNDNTMSRYRDAGTTMYRTDIQGDITLHVDRKGNMTWSFGKNAGVQANPSGRQRTRNTPAPRASYIGNSRTKTFHDPQCPNAARISGRNRIDLGSDRDEAVAEGYRPAGCCRP